MNPNPVKHLLYLNSKNGLTVLSISIYNMPGQLLLTQSNLHAPIDLSGWQTGNYLVKAVTDKGIVVGKFIKE